MTLKEVEVIDPGKMKEGEGRGKGVRIRLRRGGSGTRPVHDTNDNSTLGQRRGGKAIGCWYMGRRGWVEDVRVSDVYATMSVGLVALDKAEGGGG